MKTGRNRDNTEKYSMKAGEEAAERENGRSRQMVREALDQVNRVILGKEREIQEIMLAFLAGGHVLLEDIPGVGKTTLAVAFSQAMRLEYRRVQFTPDVLPSDLTGFSIYRREEERFVYQPGSVFCNLLLADGRHRDELLGRLYQMTEPEGGIFQACQAPSRKDPLFRLTRDLYWYKNETLIWHFSLEHLKEELTEMSFAV